MKVKTAILTGLTGLMLSAGLGSDAFAQPYRYPDRDSSYGREYRSRGYWQAQQVVREAYREILQREPDRSGLREYTDAIMRRGWSERDVRRSLLRSPEYAQRFGDNRYRDRRYR